jgi:hypothetical protein
MKWTTRRVDAFAARNSRRLGLTIRVRVMRPPGPTGALVPLR